MDALLQDRQDQRMELFHAHVAQIDPVHPGQLVDVKDGRTFGDACDVEYLDQFFQRIDLLIAFR